MIDEDHDEGCSVRATATSTTRVLRIDCADCEHRESRVCDDCLVTFLCEREADGAVVVPMEEVRVVRLLQDRGLAPRNRHLPVGADSTSSAAGVVIRGAPWGDGRTA